MALNLIKYAINFLLNKLHMPDIFQQDNEIELTELMNLISLLMYLFRNDIFFTFVTSSTVFMSWLEIIM